MSAPMSLPSRLDPLVEFYGRWNTGRAEDCLPLPLARAAKYECLGGYLTTSPHAGSANSYGEFRLAALLDGPVRAAGFVPYGTVNLRFADDTWIQPELAVLREPAGGVTWVSPEQVLLLVEFAEGERHGQHRIDKPELCAHAGVPWYLWVEIDYPARSVYVRLSGLVDGHYEERAAAGSGERLRFTEPFPVELDPAELLEP